MTKRIEWTDASAATYTAESTVINGHTVTVCLDDEGPMTPAYWWDIDDDRTTAGNNGWERTIAKARKAAIAHARTMEAGQ